MPSDYRRSTPTSYTPLTGTQKENVTNYDTAKRRLLHLTPLLLTACGGEQTSSGETESQSQIGAHKIAFELNDQIWNVQDINYVPRNGNTTSSAVHEINGEHYYFAVLMFDVPFDAPVDMPNLSNLLVFKVTSDGLVPYDQKLLEGNGRMYFGDLDADGYDEMAIALAGEDGRSMTTSEMGQKQIVVYDVGLKSLTYVGHAAWSDGTAIVDVNYDGVLEFIDSYYMSSGADTSARVYSTPNFDVIFKTDAFRPGSGFVVQDIDNDGFLEIWQINLDSDNNIFVQISQIDHNFQISLEQEFLVGTYDGQEVDYVSWNGDPENPISKTMGQLLGRNFGSYETWHKEFGDVNSVGYLDLVEIYSLEELVDTGNGYYITGSQHYMATIYLSDEGVFSADNRIDLELTFSGSHHTNKLIDLDLDGDLDIYFGVTSSYQNTGSGYPLNDRIYLNDGNGNFTKISDSFDFAFSEEFTSNGEYVAANIDGETYLIGLSTDVNGNDLSSMIIPISSEIM